jgi:tetratricopeptide (TPR) repeat protein
MKTTKLQPRLPGPRPITMSRIWSLFALGMLVLAGMNSPLAAAGGDQDKPGATSSGQVSVYSISNEESSAYDAAMSEQDAQKRAEKLYDFIQKFPQSPLIKRISNENYDRMKKIEDEHTAYYYATQETDPEKRAVKLIDFNKAYPQSTLAVPVRNTYMEMLESLHREKKNDLVASIGEKWLAVYANDRNACAFVGDASMQLGKYERCGECLEVVYGSMPSPKLARQIQVCYQKSDNRAKFIEWAEKLFAMPEFDSDYMLRQDCMMLLYNDNKLSKAAEYAQLTLKSADMVKAPGADTQEQLRKVRRASHHIIASSLMDQGKFTDAISEFEKALEAEKYAQGYYGIALCYDNSKKIDEAILYYAVTELMGGGEAPKAKVRLETLYKAIHNDTLIGIDKVYSKAQKFIDGQKS